MFSGKWRPFIIDLNVLTYASTYPSIIFSSYIQYLQQHKHNASKLTQAKKPESRHFILKTNIHNSDFDTWYKNMSTDICLCICQALTHWGRVTHICVIKLTIIGSDNGLSPGRRQAIIWTNAGILLIGPLGTNFSENLIEILKLSFTKIRLKVSSAKCRPFCLGLNVLTGRLCQHTQVPNAMRKGQCSH